MVKVSAPALSLDASGSLGGSLVFAKWKGRNYVRTLVTPSNPKSGPQVSVRAMMRALSQDWTNLSTGDKADWQDRADQLIASTFNAFCSYNLSRWRHFKAPSKLDPATEVGAAPSAPTTTPSNGVREIQLSIADGATVPDWFWLIFRSTVTGFTPSFSNLVRVVKKTATPTLYIDTGLITGTPYYYRIKGTLATGVSGTLEAERTGTPT